MRYLQVQFRHYVILRVILQVLLHIFLLCVQLVGALLIENYSFRAFIIVNGNSLNLSYEYDVYNIGLKSFLFLLI